MSDELKILVVVCLFVPTALILFGISMLVFSTRYFILAIQSNSWPSCRGFIDYASIQLTGSSDSLTYQPRLQYVYEVNNKSYRGRVISFDFRNGTTYDAAKKSISQFDQSNSINVYYSPAQPKLAVLNPGWSFYNILVVVIALVLVIGGSVMLNGLWPKSGFP